MLRNFCFDKKVLKESLQIIKRMSKLEILTIVCRTEDNISCMELAKLPLANLHTLMLLDLVMTQKSFHEFVRLFLSVPCNHPQKLILERIRVKSLLGDTITMHKFGCQNNPLSTVPFMPELEPSDRSYLYLKTVKLTMLCAIPLVLNWSQGGSLICTHMKLSQQTYTGKEFPGRGNKHLERLVS